MHQIKSRANLPTNTCLIDSKGFHSSLHPIKACTFPDKINTEPMVNINRNPLKTRIGISTKQSKKERYKHHKVMLNSPD